MIHGLRPGVREALRKFADLVAMLADRAATWPPAQILEQVISSIDYEQILMAEGPEGADRWENVRELVASAAEWSEVVEPAEDEPTTPLERFLAEAALLSANDTVQGAN
jgi:DNA helicase-2/ATP-dependent DNA helicase PcrA